MTIPRISIFYFALFVLFSCNEEGAPFVSEEKTENPPLITINKLDLFLSTPKKTTTNIQFTALSNWYIVVNNNKADISWIALEETSGEAGTVDLKVAITEPNPSSLQQRKVYLKIVSDTAFRVVTITQPARPSSEVAVSSVSLNKSEIRCAVGTAKSLSATIAPANATNQSVVWSSSDPSIATVDQSGVVSAQKYGSAMVTATTIDADKAAQCRVTVLATPESGGAINGWN